VLSGGLQIETPAQLTTEALAYGAIDRAVRRLDRRQGWRGPLAHLPRDADRDALRARLREAYGERPLHRDPRRWRLALVTAVDVRHATVQIGDVDAHVPLRAMAWAAATIATAPSTIARSIAPAPPSRSATWSGCDLPAATPSPQGPPSHAGPAKPAGPSASDEDPELELDRGAEPHRDRPATASRSSSSARPRASRPPSTPSITRQRLRRRDGGRQRLRPLAVQPDHPGLPPAGICLQGHLLLARPRRRRVAHGLCPRGQALPARARRGLEPPEPRQDPRRRGAAADSLDPLAQPPLDPPVPVPRRRGGVAWARRLGLRPS
jgi:hypothetical protein